MEILFISKNTTVEKSCGAEFTHRAVVLGTASPFVMPLVRIQADLLELSCDIPTYAKLLSAYSDRKLLKIANKTIEEMQKPNADLSEAILLAVDLIDDEIAAEQAENDKYAIDDQELYSYTLAQS